jgi:hypothetical protein
VNNHSVVPAKAGTHTLRRALLRALEDGLSQQHPLVIMGPGLRRDDICKSYRTTILGLSSSSAALSGTGFSI